ncbi:MAG: hypothetical protein RJB15_1768, partial [Pseudomonadota bacterium]
RTGAKLIALTGAPNSSLAKLADAHLDTSVEKEACPLNLAPTTSTTAALAMGDALAVALLDARGFQAEDFQRSHPGGRLGRKQLMHVSEVMRSFDETPKIAISASLQEALLEMTAKRMGMVVTLARLTSSTGEEHQSGWPHFRKSNHFSTSHNSSRAPSRRSY